jgi:signal transduction histidine kinase
MSETVNFKTNVLLKNLVGKDLINDDAIAVVELVKNAYDARSDSVSIKFEGLDADGITTTASRLVISDSGTGMGRPEIKDKWLNIAYSDKTLAPSEHGAHFAGNKGVGRFSCDRLGEQLALLTRTKDGDLFHLDIKWPDFEVVGKKDLTIQQVPIELETISQSNAESISGLKMPNHGTVLVISQLRSIWDREKLLGLKRSLEKFLSPNQTFLKKKFEIEIEVPDLKKSDAKKPYLEKINGVVQNQVFTKLQFNSSFIESEIDAGGGSVSTVLSHEGEHVFKLTENNVLPLKNVKVVIYFLNPYKKAYFKRQTGVRSVDFGSIFLFLNGFRIAPYGDRGDDWLGLDVRKAQGIARYLSSRDVVGRVEVFDDEEMFKPISSREGLKKTEAFIQLRNGFILEVLGRLEKFVVDGLNWDSIPVQLRAQVMTDEGLDWKRTPEKYTESWDKKKQRIALSIMTFIGSSQERITKFWFNPSLLEGVYEQRTAEAEGLLKEIEGYDSTQIDSGLKHGLSKIRKLLADKDQAAKVARNEATNLRMAVAQQRQKLGKLTKETETYKAQTLFLQSVTSLDAKSLVAFHHEICLNASIVDNYIGKTVKALRQIDGTGKALEHLEKISLANKRITAIAQFATKANFKSSTGKEPTDIPSFFEQYILNVARDFIASGLTLEVNNSVKEAFEVRARRIELSILIDNLISNSSKAQARTVHVGINKLSANALRISFIDDGRGLPEAISNPDAIFEIGITTTTGSGLGLYHSREIVHELGGTIKAIPLTPKGLEIRMELMR